MKKILVVCFIAALMVSLTSCGAVSSLKSVSNTGDAFMQALKDGDNAASWSMLAQNIKDEMGSEAAWADFTSVRNFDDWSFSSNSIENGSAKLDGEATLGTDTYLITLNMESSGDSWLVSGINIELK
jgi:hypothetical protein